MVACCAACVAAQASNSTPAPSIELHATFNSASAASQFGARNNVESLSEQNVTLTFRFVGANASSDVTVLLALSDAERLAQYGMTAVAAVTETPTATMAPTAPVTAAPPSADQRGLLFALLFEPGYSLRFAARQAVHEDIARAANVPLGRLAFLAAANIQQITDAEAVQVLAVERFHVLPPTLNSSANVTWLNSQIIGAAPAIVAAVRGAAELTFGAGISLSTIEDISREGAEQYLTQKLKFMAALIVVFVFIAAGLIGGWFRTVQLADAASQMRAAQREAASAAQAMGGERSAPGPYGVANTSVSSAVNATPANDTFASIAASTTRPRRSVSFHSSAMHDEL